MNMVSVSASDGKVRFCCSPGVRAWLEGWNCTCSTWEVLACFRVSGTFSMRRSLGIGLLHRYRITDHER